MNSLSNNEFKIVKYLYNQKYTNQRDLSSSLSLSLGNINKTINLLIRKNVIDKDFLITKKGLEILRMYKVDNAIIMAAGMSTRFAPLSYEKPKGLLSVKGEIIIERQIKQLKKSGINNIYLVVGYMKEKFFYLEKKYNVKLIVNEDYYRYNNTSTLMKVIDKLRNTYICSSDNYFVDNVFDLYNYDSYYSVVYQRGKSDEYGVITNKKKRIISINHEPNDMIIMQGHVYFNRTFSNKFKKILLAEYNNQDIKNNLWEKLLERYLKELEIYAKEYDANKVLEFDSLDDLKRFDRDYLVNNDSKIIDNICSVLKCKSKEIEKIEIIKNGLTNMSFKFACKGKNYVYRHPGIGTEEYISRSNEASSLKIAKQYKIDNTFIFMDKKKGWKISKYINSSHTLDYHNMKEVKKSISLMKSLHNKKIKAKYNFDLWKKTLLLINKTKDKHKDYDDFNELQKKMKKLYDLTRKDKAEWILCHCDCYNPNFLFDKFGNVNLIDWEYSGNDDPANDIGTFICCSDYSYEESLHIIDLYYDNKPSKKEIRHCIAYIALCSYYWYVWAIYQESVGKIVGEYLLLWYQNANEYMERAFNMYGVNYEQ